jgi:PP-loop superfamily ATP-utilizing enzyme
MEGYKIYRENEIRQNIIDYVWHTPIIRSVKRCLLCNRLRYARHHQKLLWQSNYILDTFGITEIFTICPKCRIRPINDIYEKLINRKLSLKRILISTKELESKDGRL